LSASKKGDSESDVERDTHLTEWQTARALLAAYDDNLHDLRKYGFTFLTALLATESILLPSVGVSSTSGGLPDIVKLGVFVVTLLLVFALHLIDQNYLVFENAAATRALVLERELNIELTEIIADRYEAINVPRRVFNVYLVFALGVLVLGFFVFGSHIGYDILLILAFIIAWWQIRSSKNSLRVKYRYEQKDKQKAPSGAEPGDRKGWTTEARDWTVEPLNCADGDYVKITVTNLWTPRVDGKKPKVPKASAYPEGEPGVPEPIRYPANSVIWQIEDEEGNVKYKEVPKKDIRVFDDYTWLWNTTGITKGVGTSVFQVHPLERPLPLSRKIIVTGHHHKESIDIA
jgi:hypothetical protein